MESTLAETYYTWPQPAPIMYGYHVHNKITQSFAPHVAPCSCLPLPASSSNPLLPAVVFLVVVVLLLITCLVLLVLALAVTANKLNKLRAKNGHNDSLHCYNPTEGEEKTKEGIYDEVGEGSGATEAEGQKGHYQELKLETMDKRQYETLHGGHKC